MRAGIAASALGFALIAGAHTLTGCAQKAASPVVVPLTDTDGGNVDAPGVPAPNARCCVLPTDAGVNVSDECTVAARGIGLPDAAPTGLAEPCWENNQAGAYALWTCGADAGARCGNNGLSCDVGSVCRLDDVSNASGGCLGTVQPCYYPWP